MCKLTPDNCVRCEAAFVGKTRFFAGNCLMSGANIRPANGIRNNRCKNKFWHGNPAKMVVYVDHFYAAGSILSLKYWWDTLCELGPKFDYFSEPTN